MATVNHTSSGKIGSAKDRAYVITWTSIPNGDQGDAVEMFGSADRSVQLGGTFSTGGSVTIEGSNDGTNYVALKDPQGNAITKTAGAIEMVTELTRYIRPNVTAGDGSTAITVSLFVKGSI